MISFSILLATFFLSVASLPHFDHVVIFGDSYSDVDNPVITTSAAWPTYLSSYTGLGASVKSYAKQAKQCIHIQTEQLPQFIRAVTHPPPESTLYIVFVGFNDLAALGGKGNATWDDRLKVSSCPVQVMSNLTVIAGAKYFLWFKMVPFEIVPLFMPPNGSFKNIGPQVARLGELGNSLTTALLEDFAATNMNLSVGIFDTYSLFNDIHTHPSSYLNGSLPPDVNNYVTRNKSRPVNADVRDSFMWWDQNHPSEQTNRIVARRVADGMAGSTEWVSWLPSKPPTSQSLTVYRNKKTIVALGFAIGVLYSW
ncbi:hypothetical protein EXIGLDRAFT_728066 [Exidia glandulosa HHB12029]|uniref:SGNH hydrolase n=1 Tax=Exidia glandulosa HHB12029 TaxID=1314781 RepID=A0A165ZL59_EXIGL|nr:hypothetical protein EXIGLDRAFT_728066 [Exidia glandulosa HHB12029]